MPGFGENQKSGWRSTIAATRREVSVSASHAPVHSTSRSAK
jgi:hypothetical protein